VAGKHFGDAGRSDAVLKAEAGVQETLVEQDPDWFWLPVFVGGHGWIGMRLKLEELEPDWDLVAVSVRDAWRLSAPKKLRLALESASCIGILSAKLGHPLFRNLSRFNVAFC
jgi:hypothetical protein